MTGGYVYRGQEAPALQGWYICGDFESRRVWAVKRSNAERPELIEIGRTPSRLVSFAQTHSGELLVVGFDDGVIQKMHLDQVDLQPARRKILVETSEEAPVLWRYTTAVPADDWNQSGFDDAAWNQAPGGFGTTGTPGGIIRTDWRTPDIWLRRDFDLSEAVGDDDELMLRIHHDEDVELYLNGTPLMRLSRWTSSYTEVALPKDAVKLFKAGRNSLAVHCHQNGGGQFIDCGFIVYTAK